jgi:hypothetical protein
LDEDEFNEQADESEEEDPEWDEQPMSPLVFMIETICDEKRTRKAKRQGFPRTENLSFGS